MVVYSPADFGRRPLGADVELASRKGAAYGDAMSDFDANFADPERVKRYTEQGPPAFAPGHGGMLQMIGVLLGESMPETGQLLVIGAGGGLEIRYLAGVERGWRFVGVDPAGAMLDLARAVAGPVGSDRMTLIEGTVEDAPTGPFDAATCILVLGLIADDGGKLALLNGVRSRLKFGAPLILVDQCIDRSAPDFERRLSRYANFALRSNVDPDTVTNARVAVEALQSMVPPGRNEDLLREAGFREAEVFYVGMAWRGWIAYS